jgi:hypothetical protein
MTMPQANWMLSEIADEEEFARRFANSDDPVQRAQAERAVRSAERMREALNALSVGARVSLRLTGRSIENHNAPIEAVAGLIGRLRDLASDFGADVLVAPASPGSHIIELTGPAERSLFEHERYDLDPDTPMADLARVLLDLASPHVPDEDAWATRLEHNASELSQQSLLATKGIVEVLTQHHLTVEVELASRHRSGRARISELDAAFVHRILSDVDRVETRETIEGALVGFTEGSGRFEIRPENSAELVTGRVPAALRRAARGIRIDSRVRGEIDLVETRLRSGATRIHRRLVSIAAL